MSTRGLIGTFSWMLLNGMGLVLSTSSNIILKFIGYFNYLITSCILLFIVYQYMNSPFYKNLGLKEKSK